MAKYLLALLSSLTRSIRNSETSIDFVQGTPGSRRERVKKELDRIDMEKGDKRLHDTAMDCEDGDQLIKP